MKKTIGLVIACSLFLVGCGGKDGEKPIWSSKIESLNSEKETLDSEKQKLEGLIEGYKEGRIGQQLYFLANTQVELKEFFKNKDFADYVAELTQIEIVDEVIKGENFGFLVKIKYPDIMLSYYSNNLNGENKLKSGEKVSSEELKEAFEKNPKWKETEVILSSSKKQQTEGDYKYISEGNLFKALTGGLRLEEIIIGNTENCEKYNKILEEELVKVRGGNIHRRYRDKPHYNLLKSEKLDKIRAYFAENTTIKVLETRENQKKDENIKEKAIVSHPDYDLIINESIRNGKTTEEIIQELNKAIKEGKIKNKEEILVGEIIETKDGVLYTGDFLDFFLNLGINGINKLN